MPGGGTTIYDSNLHVDMLSRNLAEQVTAFRDYLNSHCTQFQIPYFQQDGGVLYFTFAGYLINKAIGLSTGKDFKADELTLWARAPIDWANVGDNPASYEECFPSLFEVSSDLSLYQSMLPPGLQLREFLQPWLKDETILLALKRLRNSKSVLVGANFATGETV